MKKIKKFLTENRVLVVLAIILVICFGILITSLIIAFYGSSENSYGSRLDITEKVPLTDETITLVKDGLTKEKSVEKVNITTKGKIVYIDIKFVDSTKLKDAKEITKTALTPLSEEQLKVYELHFTITSKFPDNEKQSYTLMGARNKNGSGEIVWNNYNKEESKK